MAYKMDAECQTECYGLLDSQSKLAKPAEETSDRRPVQHATHKEISAIRRWVTRAQRSEQRFWRRALASEIHFADGNVKRRESSAERSERLAKRRARDFARRAGETNAERCERLARRRAKNRERIVAMGDSKKADMLAKKEQKRKMKILSSESGTVTTTEAIKDEPKGDKTESYLDHGNDSNLSETIEIKSESNYHESDNVDVHENNDTGVSESTQIKEEFDESDSIDITEHYPWGSFVGSTQIKIENNFDIGYVSNHESIKLEDDNQFPIESGRKSNEGTQASGTEKEFGTKQTTRFTNEDINLLIEILIPIETCNIEKPRAQIFYEKLMKEHDFLKKYPWTCIRNKVRSLKTKFARAVNWQHYNCPGLIEPSDQEIINKICPLFDQLYRIWGSKEVAPQFKRVRKIIEKQWPMDEVCELIEVLAPMDPRSIEKPTEQIFYQKLVDENDFLAKYPWYCVMDKVRYLKMKFDTAIDWRYHTCLGLLEPRDIATIHRICPLFDDLYRIWGNKMH